jgi:hypothetical protein
MASPDRWLDAAIATVRSVKGPTNVYLGQLRIARIHERPDGLFIEVVGSGEYGMEGCEGIRYACLEDALRAIRDYILGPRMYSAC